MKRYNPVIVTDTDDLIGNIRAMMQIEENGKWYKAEDVAELAKNVLSMFFNRGGGYFALEYKALHKQLKRIVRENEIRM